MEIQILRPLSQGEIAGKKETFIDTLFSNKLPESTLKPISRNELQRIAIIGGYPEVRQRKTSQRRQAWYRNYITTIIHRDIRDMANINGLTKIPDVLNILATRCANLLNYADLASSLQIPQTSLKRYMSLLESIFLIYRLKSWNVNLSSRISKSPKVYLNDTGLIAYLTGADEQRMNTDNLLGGSIVENFVVNELYKQAAWSETCPELFHFRTHSGYEVDVILENTQGKCVAVEVKSSATISAHDVKNMRYLKNEIKDRFIRGVVLYTGPTTVPFDKNIHAVPVHTLWS
jgi:predicted AAA+ superfamily ATPase